jgi:hypothetical protein
MTSAERSKLVRLQDTHMTIAATDSDIRQEEKVRFFEVATGGFLGIGKDKSFIPVDAITHIGDKDVHLNLLTDTVAGSPPYDPDLVDDSDFFYETYGYYGFLPYWGMGYVYPPYPYYPGRYSS